MITKARILLIILGNIASMIQGFQLLSLETLYHKHKEFKYYHWKIQIGDFWVLSLDALNHKQGY